MSKLFESNISGSRLFILQHPLISDSRKSPLCFILSPCNYNTYCETAAVFLPKANTPCRLTQKILLAVPLSSSLWPPLFLYALVLHFLIERSGALSGEDVEVAKVCRLIGVSHKNTPPPHTHTHTHVHTHVCVDGDECHCVP